MPRARLALIGGAVLLVSGAAVGTAIQNGTLVIPDSDRAVPAEAVSALTEATSEAADAPAAPRAERPRAAPLAPLVQDETPMVDRVAVLGVLNKRSGVARDVTLKPGQARRLGNLIVRLRACETTDPIEPEQLTGAFVQVDLQGRDQGWRRIFSGWLYKESPSLNAVENPIYDVWPKSCAMTHPDIGPDTIAASAATPSGTTRRSSAKKSAEPREDAPATAPIPSASSSNPA